MSGTTADAADSPPHEPTPRGGPPTVGLAPSVSGLTVALAIFATLSGALTLALPDALRGTAAMNGSARGTGAVMLVAVVVMLAGRWWSRSSPARGVVVWLGAVAYLIYNAVLLLFATPFNQHFLLYVGTLSLALATAVAIVATVDLPAFGARTSPTAPARGIAVYVWVVVVLNALLWLRGVVPGVLDSSAPEFLDGTGLTTSPVYVQDLAVWLPLLAVAAWWLWRRRPIGHLLVGAGLTLWVLESLSIAVDQWMGSNADPSSPAVTSSLVPVFLVLVLVNLVPLFLLVRHMDATAGAGPA
jgi:hypothetical protein